MPRFIQALAVDGKHPQHSETGLKLKNQKVTGLKILSHNKAD